MACTVIPAYNLGKRPFGLTTTTQWYAFSQWTTNGNLDYDIAIMRLAQPIGNTTGWINLSYQSDTSFSPRRPMIFTVLDIQLHIHWVRQFLREVSGCII